MIDFPPLTRFSPPHPEGGNEMKKWCMLLAILVSLCVALSACGDKETAGKDQAGKAKKGAAGEKKEPAKEKKAEGQAATPEEKDDQAATPEKKDDQAATPEKKDDQAATPEKKDDQAATPEKKDDQAATPGKEADKAAEAAAPGAAGKVILKVDATTSGAELYRATIHKMLEEHAADYQKCYEESGEKVEAGQGEILIALTIDVDGVVSVNPVKDSFGDNKAANCLAEKMASYGFPKPGDKPATFEIPLKFEALGEGK